MKTGSSDTEVKNDRIVQEYFMQIPLKAIITEFIDIIFIVPIGYLTEIISLIHPPEVTSKSNMAPIPANSAQGVQTYTLTSIATSILICLTYADMKIILLFRIYNMMLVE